MYCQSGPCQRADQHVEGLGLAELAAHDEQLVVDPVRCGIVRVLLVRHLTLHPYSRGRVEKVRARL
jgi:hypothetical protein